MIGSTSRPQGRAGLSLRNQVLLPFFTRNLSREGATLALLAIQHRVRNNIIVMQTSISKDIKDATFDSDE